MLTTSSLHVRNVSVNELWELAVLGIMDPLFNENTKENFELTDFKNKMKIVPDGRYEVKLPWKCNSENLPSNKELTWKRHLRMNKLRNGARLVNSILKALNMPDLKVTLWSDSTTALWWIEEYGNWSGFVANRVKEIRQLKFTHGMKSLSSGPSPLPPDRVNDCAIFEVVGIDLAGPLFLKTGEKVWITLFTCAVYRALHLELVNALSSDAFC
ncbi:integrase catalytic domain-containing protein [Trichonephila clavipes]|nr:integrase catalytic domain-containing protein [Trichonephila clavipes]